MQVPTYNFSGIKHLVTELLKVNPIVVLFFQPFWSHALNFFFSEYMRFALTHFRSSRFAVLLTIKISFLNAHALLFVRRLIGTTK